MVLGALLTATAVCVLSLLGVNHLLVKAGSHKKSSNAFNTSSHLCVPGKSPFLAMLMDDQKSKSNSHLNVYFHITSASLTVLSLIGSDIFVRCFRRSQPTNASITNATNASPAIINTIPFFTLNISIALTIVLYITLVMFGVNLLNTNGLPASLLLAGLLVTNKRAWNHLQLRLQQKIDSLTIGRSNRVDPVVVSIALVPVRDFRGIQ